MQYNYFTNNQFKYSDLPNNCLISSSERGITPLRIDNKTYGMFDNNLLSMYKSHMFMGEIRPANTVKTIYNGGAINTRYTINVALYNQDVITNPNATCTLTVNGQATTRQFGAVTEIATTFTGDLLNSTSCNITLVSNCICSYNAILIQDEIQS